MRCILIARPEECPYRKEHLTYDADKDAHVIHMHCEYGLTEGIACVDAKRFPKECSLPKA